MLLFSFPRSSSRSTVFLSLLFFAGLAIITTCISTHFAYGFIVSIIGLIALSLLGAHLFSIYFLQPAKDLLEIIQKIARREFPLSILRKSPFEIGALETALEQMSRELAKTFQTLSNKRSQIEAILSSLTQGLVAVDKNGRIVLSNPPIENFFLANQTELVGKTIREGLRNNDLADIIEETLRSSTPIKKEFVLLPPVEKFLVAHASPILSIDGISQGAVCILYDITEMHKLEQYRRDFVANVSHELKTPLTAIQSYIETLLGGAINDPQNNLKFLEKIEKHTLNLSTLINDILELSKLDSGAAETPFTPVNLKRTIEHTVETLAEKARAKNIAVSFSAVDTIIQGIEDYLYRAILNLLDNAINYTPAGGNITITLNQTGQQVEVTVRDNGIGIAKEHLEHIFERFYRIDKARSRDMGGTGLGLAIVKHIMQLHRGQIEVQSEEGNGSIFTLVFP